MKLLTRFIDLYNSKVKITAFIWETFTFFGDKYSYHYSNDKTTEKGYSKPVSKFLFVMIFNSKYVTGAKRGNFCFFLNGTRGDVDSNIRDVPVNVECDPRITCSQSFQRGQCFKDAPTMSLIRVRHNFILLNIHSFPLRISSVNVTKSAASCGFGHIY